MEKIFLSTIIPAYNEEDNFSHGALEKVYHFLNEQPYTWELILVNDGSLDRTSQLLHEFASKSRRIRVIDNPHQGKAASIITGAAASRGQIVLFSDMDQATPISEFEKFLPKFSSGYEIVIGSRSNRQGAPLYRQILAYGMVVFRTLLLRLPYKDTQCGFKAFSRRAADALFPIMQKVHPPHEITGPAVNPGFDVELLYLGRKLGYKIAQVPVTWKHQKSARVRFFHDALSGVSELFLVRYRAFTNLYSV